MIEKKLYYVWIGDGKKPDTFYKCYESWSKNLKDYKIIEINERNFDINSHLKKNKFFRKCYKKKAWAYVADYIRVHFMYENSGIYVDTDMEIIKDLSLLLEDKNTEFFIGYENEQYISAGIFGCKKNSEILLEMMKFYEREIWTKPLWTIPKIFTYIFEKNYELTSKRENELNDGKIKIYPKEYFYPFGYGENFSENSIKENTYGIHWWEKSWNTLRIKLFIESKHLKGIKKYIKKLKIVCRHLLEKIKNM